MRRVLPAALVGATMWLGGEAFAAAAVFGSFQARGNAERFCTGLVRHPELGVRVVAVETGRGQVYRVISAAGSEAETRALMARARALGIADVWYWADAPEVEPKTVQVAEEPMPADVVPAEDEAAPSVAAEPPPAVADTETEGTPPAQGRDLHLVADGEAIVVPRLDSADITIDGKLDEAIWSDIPGHDNMVIVEPDLLTPPRFRTVNRFFYTDRGLYVGVWNEQPPDTLIARLSSRDDYINRDSWTLTLDTSGEGLYGYWFSVNLGGTVGDGKVAPERNYSREWDGPWDSATAELDDGWSTELFLPWSMMSMPRATGDRVMGIFASRKVAYLDERWGWPGAAAHGGAVHVRAAADVPAGRGAEGAARSLSLLLNSGGCSRRQRKFQRRRRCLLASVVELPGHPPRLCRISARWRPMMWSSISRRARPISRRSACSSWRAARSSPPPVAPQRRAPAAAAAAPA